MNDTQYVNWATYLTDITALLDNIKRVGAPLAFVHGIEPSGLIPATIIASQLSLQLLNPSQMVAELISGAGQVLVVNSVTSVGTSFLRFREHRDRCLLVSVYRRSVSSTLMEPDLCVHDVDADWVVLPYEPDKREIPVKTEMPDSSR